MRLRRFVIMLVMVSVVPVSAAPRFAARPQVEVAGGRATIRFAVSEQTDVAVAIRDASGRVVRHLAAGRLGPYAPEPLKAGSLRQSLRWDGTDDRGKPLPRGRYSLHVGLGLTASFDRVIGQDRQWLGNIHALGVGPKGGLYCLCSRGLVLLDRRGRYVRQIAPHPAALSDAQLAGRGPVTLKDGTRYFQRDYPFPGKFVGSIAVTARGEVLLPGAARYTRNLLRIGTDGSVKARAFDTRLTALQDVGFLYLAADPTGKLVYMAGHESGYKGDDAREVSYRQSVYRLHLDGDGPAENWIGDDENTGGPGSRVSKPKGLAVDPDGQVYICNHRRGDVAVYDAGAGLQKVIKVARPQQVAVHPKTRQVYVLAGREAGYRSQGYNYPPRMSEARIIRFSPDGKEQIKLELPAAFERKASRTRPGGPQFKLRMAVDFSGKRPVVWIGVAYPDARYSKYVLLRIVDEGERFGEPAECCPIPEGTILGAATHIALDRSRDVVYYNDGSTRLQRWTGGGEALPALKFRDPKTGGKQYIAEVAIGPDGLIYGTTWGPRGLRHNAILRMDTDGKRVPFPATGEADPAVRHAMKGGSGRSSRGLTVAPNGEVYVMHYDDELPADQLPEVPWDRGYRLTITVARFAADGSLKDPRVIRHLRAGGSCIRVDSRGNLYVGDNTMALGVGYPADFAGVLPDPLERFTPARLPNGRLDPLMRSMGSVFRYAPGGGKVVGVASGPEVPRTSRPAGDLFRPAPAMQWFVFNNHRLRIEGAAWQFHGFSPVPAQYHGVTHVDRCFCLGGRFDLDQFDRLFVPDVLRHRVTVLDREGNVLTRFGRYGNQDETGDGIPLAQPGWLAAASDRLYIGDGRAGRIVRVKLGYAKTAEAELRW
jgi:hypothetical protein